MPLPTRHEGHWAQADLPGSNHVKQPMDLGFSDRLSSEQFAFFQTLAMRHAGISLPSYKRNMVHRRVSKRLTALRLQGFSNYIEFLTGPRGSEEIEFLINALTTNKTEFFRESHHFEHLANVIVPAYLERVAKTGNSRLRIWSAGCSSGQEPYSVALTLAAGIADISRRDVRVLATDIDTDMVQHGREATYDAEELSRIPDGLRQRYVDMGFGGGGRFKPSIRSLVTFNQLNLHGAWPMKGRFDVVFCRNVIIYFDKPTQIRLFDRFANQMTDDGHLYIGHSESLYRVTERFAVEGQSIYRRIT